MELSLHGIGMFMTMVCTPISSLHTPTVCGGTGDGHTVSMVPDGDSVLDGTLHGTHHGIPLGTLLGITADGTLLGTQVIGAVTGVATGDRDGITIIHIMDGTADGTVPDIQTTDPADTSHITEEVLLLVQVRHIQDDLKPHQL